MNNHTDPQKETLVGVLTASSQYFVFGLETGASGTPHLQGMTYYKNARTLASVKNEMRWNSHLEICRDTQAYITYCKKDGEFVEWGTPPTVGSGKIKENLAAGIARIYMDLWRQVTSVT